MVKEEFESQLKEFVEGLQDHISTKDGQRIHRCVLKYLYHFFRYQDYFKDLGNSPIPQNYGICKKIWI